MHYKVSPRSAISKLIKAKQGTKDMLRENKLTNLVFKNQKNSAKHNLLPFSPFFLIKKKNPRMKCMNVMQCES